jgi:molecular chaperone HtpG
MKTFKFETETSQILELLTHSIYSNKEIFIREIISNSSDAIDKAKIKSLQNTKYLGDDVNFEIKVDFDKKNKTITIVDN